MVRRGQRNVSCDRGREPAGQTQRKAHGIGLPLLLVPGLSLVFIAIAALFPHLIMGVIFGSRFIEIGWLLALMPRQRGCIR